MLPLFMDNVERTVIGFVSFMIIITLVLVIAARNSDNRHLRTFLVVFALLDTALAVFCSQHEVKLYTSGVILLLATGAALLRAFTMKVKR